MFERFVGKNLKIIFRDGSQNKAISGVLEKTDEDFVCVVSGNSNILISKRDIVSVIQKQKGSYL